MHQLKQINFSHSPNDYSEVIVYEDITAVDKRFATKVEYQRSVVKQIVWELLGEEITINHKESGAPFIVEFPEKNISISHSQDYYAIQLSDKNKVGVDIQVFKKNLAKGRDYFVNEWEEKSLDLTELNLHLVWSAKEAFYKLQEGDIEKYKDEMIVREIGVNQIMIENDGVRFNLSYQFSEHFVLVHS